MSKINSLISFITQSIIIALWTKATFRILSYWVYHCMLWSRIYQRLDDLFCNNNIWWVSQVFSLSKSNIKIKVICDNLKKGELFSLWPKSHSINLHAKPNIVENFPPTKMVCFSFEHQKNSQRYNGAEKFNFLMNV